MVTVLQYNHDTVVLFSLVSHTYLHFTSTVFSTEEFIIDFYYCVKFVKYLNARQNLYYGK